MTALSESFYLTSIHNIFSWPILTSLLYSQIGKLVLDSGQGSWFQDQWDHSPTVVGSQSMGSHGAREVELPVFLVLLAQV